MTCDYTLDQVEALRDLRYHRTPSLRLHNEDQALEYVDKVGFCFLFGDQDVEIPTLWAAITGSRRDVPSDHFDADVGRTWEWKDSLPVRGLIYYGKLLRAKPTLVSLGLLPCFYALSPNYGELDDYLEQYRDGLLSLEARNVYEALLKEGAMATSRLRQVVGLPGGGANARRFDRALAELQVGLQIVKVGISDANRWGYAYVYDLFLRRFPTVPALARTITRRDAMGKLLSVYLHNVIVQSEAVTQRLFRWDSREWEQLLADLAGRGLLRRDITVEGLPGDLLGLSPNS